MSSQDDISISISFSAEEDRKPSVTGANVSRKSSRKPADPAYARMMERNDQAREIVRLKEKIQELMNEIRELERRNEILMSERSQLQEENAALRKQPEK